MPWSVVWIMVWILGGEVLAFVLVRTGILPGHVLTRREWLIIWVTILCAAALFLIVGSLWVFRS